MAALTGGKRNKAGGGRLGEEDKEAKRERESAGKREEQREVK